MAASEGKLGKLHEKLAEVMTTALDQYSTAQEAYDEAVQVARDTEDLDMMPMAPPDINPSLLSVMERMLNNNKITCVPEEGNAMGELEKKLEAKKQRKLRAGGTVANVTHLESE